MGRTLTGTPSAPRPERTRARVLIVDDEEDQRQLLAMALSQDRYDVETAGTGAAAVELSRQRKFHIAIVDLMMAGMDGMATLVALKKEAPGLEVIIATSYATVESAIACMKEGAFDYVKKPFNLTELRLRIERALEHSQHLDALGIYEATRALMATMMHSDLVRLVVGMALQVLRSDSVGLAVRDADAGPWRFHRTVGAPHISDALLGRLAERLASGQLGKDAPQILAVPGVVGAGGGGPAGAPELPLGPDDGRVGSALLLPLPARDRLLGVLLAVRGLGAPPFGDFEAEQARRLAAETTLALDNECLYRELEARGGRARP